VKKASVFQHFHWPQRDLSGERTSTWHSKIICNLTSDNPLKLRKHVSIRGTDYSYRYRL